MVTAGKADAHGLRTLIAERLALRRLVGRMFAQGAAPSSPDRALSSLASDSRLIDAALEVGGVPRVIERYLQPDLDDAAFVTEGVRDLGAVNGLEARRLAVNMAADSVAIHHFVKSIAEGAVKVDPSTPLDQVKDQLRPLRLSVAKDFWKVSRGEAPENKALFEAANDRTALYVEAVRDPGVLTPIKARAPVEKKPAKPTKPVKAAEPSPATPAKKKAKDPSASPTAALASAVEGAKPSPAPRPPKIFSGTLRIDACSNDYLQMFRSQVNALERVALRERSWRTREILATTASEGVLGFEDLVGLYRQTAELGLGARSGAAFGLRGHTLRALLALARVTASQGLRPSDDADALTLYRAIYAQAPDALREMDVIQMVMLLLGASDLQTAAMVLERSALGEARPVEFALLLSNLLLHAGLARGGPRPAEHLHALNLLYRAQGYEDVRIGDAPTAFGGLTTAPLNHFVTDGPKVSVLMTTFNPNLDVGIAIRSVLDQSWRNLQLIIIDDCSSDANFSIVKAWEARDPRIAVLQQTVNQGTYAAKNQGLAIADGEFVTCHDSDDWSHPRKIEHQMEALFRANAVASISHWVRSSPQMEFQIFSGGGLLSYDNPSSLLYRTAPIREKIGFYDSVRTGADSEFKHRIETVFKQPTADASEVPLAFGLVHEAALTANTLGRGWFSHDRRVYRSAWHTWHAELKSNPDDAYVPLAPAQRRFEVPETIRPIKPMLAEERTHYDVVMISDFRMGGGNTISAIEEAKAQSRAGLRTAICQVGAFRKGFMHKEFVDPKVQALFSDGLVDWIELGSDVRADVLTIRYPGVFQFAEGMTSGIEAGAIRVILNQPPSEADATDRRYDVDTCRRNIDRIFGPGQLWAPIGPSVRDAVVSVMKPEELTERDWYNVIDVDEWGGVRTGFVGDRPVIGRHGRDDYSKWPDTRESLFAAYPADNAFKVNILGGAASIAGLLQGPPPSNWTVHEFNAVDPATYLSGIDFFVFHHHPQRIEAFGRTVIEALASGCVAILPETFRPLFGDSAIYCAPDEVQGIVRELYADLDRYIELSRKGVDYVRSNFGYEAHLTRLEATKVRGRDVKMLAEV